jgi:hypothetical protein
MFQYSERERWLMQRRGDPQVNRVIRNPNRAGASRYLYNCLRQIVPIFEPLTTAMHGAAALPHVDERFSHSKMQSIQELSAEKSA